MAEINLDLFALNSVTNDVKETISLQSCRDGADELGSVCFEQRQIHGQDVSPFK
jgi:hypothetical protein